MVISTQEIQKDLRKRLGSRCLGLSFSDSQYVFPTFKYLTNEFLPWFHTHLKNRGFLYATERFDCDDFADEFSSSLKEAGLKLRESAGIPVATMRVRNITTSFGVGEGLHVVNLVGTLTKQGVAWIVVEPQNQKYALLEDYTTAVDFYISF